MSQKTKRLTTLAMLCAVAYVVMLVFKIPIMPAAPFLELDFKDVIITVGGFIYGPLSAFIISAVVSIAEMLMASKSGPIGMLMNAIASCAFACTAAFVYKRRQTSGGAVAGLALGCVLMTGMMLLWNYIITPYYTGVPREAVAAMLAPVILPFNLIKSAANAAVVLLLYKPIVIGLRKSGLLPQSGGIGGTGKIKAGMVVLGAFVLVTCLLVILMLNGII